MTKLKTPLTQASNTIADLQDLIKDHAKTIVQLEKEVSELKDHNAELQEQCSNSIEPERYEKAFGVLEELQKFVDSELYDQKYTSKPVLNKNELIELLLLLQQVITDADF